MHAHLAILRDEAQKVQYIKLGICISIIIQPFVELSKFYSYPFKKIEVKCNNVTFVGAERNVRDSEWTEPSTPRDSLRSYGSATSLNSSSSGNKEAPDTPQQLQYLKHQKEVWETGIHM